MTTIREVRNVSGIPLPNETRLVLSDKLPEQELITCSFVLAFKENELLLTNLNERGWDIPGGHIELGESPMEAMQRELYEETGVLISSAELIGYEMIRILGNKPDNYKYPFPDSYMVFYCARIIKLEDFQGNTETSGRGLFTEHASYTIPWVQNNIALYEEALRRVNSQERHK